MFDIGTSDMFVLAIIGVLVLGPERLPGLARDAAQMLRSLRELATGTRSQLTRDFGPELAALASADPRRALIVLFDAPEIPADTAHAGAAMAPASNRPRPRPYPHDQVEPEPNRLAHLASLQPQSLSDLAATR